MSAQKAFEEWRNEYPGLRYGAANMVAFHAGYAAAIEDIRKGGAAAIRCSNGIIEPTGSLLPIGSNLYLLPKE